MRTNPNQPFTVWCCAIALVIGSSAASTALASPFGHSKMSEETKKCVECHKTENTALY